MILFEKIFFDEIICPASIIVYCCTFYVLWCFTKSFKIKIKLLTICRCKRICAVSVVSLSYKIYKKNISPVIPFITCCRHYTKYNWYLKSQLFLFNFHKLCDDFNNKVIFIIESANCVQVNSFLNRIVLMAIVFATVYYPSSTNIKSNLAFQRTGLQYRLFIPYKNQMILKFAYFNCWMFWRFITYHESKLNKILLESRSSENFH